MSTAYLKQDYDGSVIHKRFAYTYFRKAVNPLGNIVALRGIMNVKENLIDLEDVLSDDFIYSDDALSFIWEIPNMEAKGAVFFQRLFVREIADALRLGWGIDTIVDGDDLFVNVHVSDKENPGTVSHKRKKMSVSITKVTDGIALGHLGLNIIAGPKAPSFAYSLNFPTENVEVLAHKCKEIFNDILADTYIATTKVI